MNFYKLSAISLLSVFLSACGGGGTPIPIEGMTSPSQISIVSDNEASSAGLSSAVKASFLNSAGVSAAFDAATTEYSKQKVNSWIKTAAGSGLLEEMNYVLCIVKTANTADYPNKVYRTQHNAKNCRRADSAWPLYGEGPLMRDLIVKSSRVAGGPQKQTMWFQIPYGGRFDNTDWNFVMDMTIYEEKSDLSPLGMFEATFKSIRNPDTNPAVDYTGTSDYDGVIKVYREGVKNYVSFVFVYKDLYSTPSSRNYETYRSIIIELDGSGGLTGKALVNSPRQHWDNAYLVRYISKVNFDEDNIHSQTNSEDAICSSRTGMYSNVWDYKMFYKDTGKEPNMNGGFPVTYTLNSVSGKRGWADKWGLSTDVEGDTPSVVTRDNGDKAIYDVVRAGGKLIKKTKGTRDLTSAEKLKYWHSGSDFDVTWNGSTFTIESKDGSANALTHLNAATTSDSRWPWSRRLNQGVKYMGTKTIVYWAEEDVKPWHDALNGGNLTLKCYQFCPQGQVSQALAAVEEWNQTAVEAVDSNAFSRTGKSYTFNATDQLLKYGTTAVILDPSISNTVESEFRMILLDSNVMPSNYWNANEENIHYIWRSGTKEWQQTVNYKNQSTNAFYEFSDPVKFDYTHLTANDLNDSATYNNISYYLEYDGGLHGIPANKNADGNYVREFSLKSGDIFNGKALLGGRELVLKAVGIEKNPLAAAAGSCSDLPLDDLGLTSPSSSPAISVSSTYADRLSYSLPDYTIIEGVVQ
jgi:hypothetical protein